MMKSIQNKFGSQQSKTAKLKTENRKTHDAKPTTLNPEPKTKLIAGPNIIFRFSVLGFEFWVLSLWMCPAGQAIRLKVK
jgi:hypothetical protein